METPKKAKVSVLKMKCTASHLAYNRGYRREEARQKAAGEPVDKQKISAAGKKAREAIA